MSSRNLIIKKIRLLKSISNKKILPPVPPPPSLDPQESRYLEKVNGYIDSMQKSIDASIVDKLGDFVKSAERIKPDRNDSGHYAGSYTEMRFDDFVDQIGQIFRVQEDYVVDVGLYEKDLTPVLEDISRVNNRWHRSVFQKVIGIDPLTSEPWLASEMNVALQESVSLIKTLQQETFADVERIVYQGIRSGDSATDMATQISDKFDLSRGRAKVIARDQTGKFFGNLTQKRQRNVGVKKYRWRTLEDERVRKDHARLDKTVHAWDDPPITVTTGRRAGERNHPGEDIQCRCYPEPIID